MKTIKAKNNPSKNKHFFDYTYVQQKEVWHPHRSRFSPEYRDIKLKKKDRPEI
jgi:hypothetical protein